jgi:DNA-binding transcriptional ArsR family regulator
MKKKHKQINYEMAAECLKVMAHPGRLQLIDLLMNHRYSVGELADITGMPANTCSEHLRLLERCGLLKGVRDGRTVYYGIAEPHLCKMMDCIEYRFAS